MQASCVLFACVLQALGFHTHGPVITVTASWYASHGRMANGRTFDPDNAHLCAYRTHRLGTRIAVRNPENGRVIVCRITDRGPYVKGRSLDVSRAGASRLGFLGRGVARLQVVVLPDS